MGWKAHLHVVNAKNSVVQILQSLIGMMMMMDIDSIDIHRGVCFLAHFIEVQFLL